MCIAFHNGKSAHQDFFWQVIKDICMFLGGGGGGGGGGGDGAL